MTTLAESIEQKKERLRVQISQQTAEILESSELVFTILRETPNDGHGLCSRASTIIDRATMLRVLAARLNELTDLPYTLTGEVVEPQPERGEHE